MVTAEEFLNNKLSKNGNVISTGVVKKLMIEFTQSHCETQIKHIIKILEDHPNISKYYLEIIKKAYPQSNIK